MRTEMNNSTLPPPSSEAERERIAQKLNRTIKKTVWNAINDFEMVESGDKIMVCLSGGKDSYTLLDVLMQIQKAAVFDFELIAVNLDQKQPGFPEEVLPQYLTKLGVNFEVVERDTYSIVKAKTPQGKTTCSLCTRLRRGTLYEAAERLQCNKIALGHHRDDILETFFLNLFFAGKIETMPPKYRTNDNRFVVLRPLAFVKEADIQQLADIRGYPIIPCNLCGSQPQLQRQVVKKMIHTWEKSYPGRSEIMFTALSNISPTHMLDANLYDFKQLMPKLMELPSRQEELELL